MNLCGLWQYPQILSLKKRTVIDEVNTISDTILLIHASNYTIMLQASTYPPSGYARLQTLCESSCRDTVIT